MKSDGRGMEECALAIGLETEPLSLQTKAVVIQFRISSPSLPPTSVTVCIRKQYIRKPNISAFSFVRDMTC